MTAITFPVTPPNSQDIEAFRMMPRAMVGVSISPFSAAQQAQRHQGQLWQAQVTLAMMPRQSVEDWLAFLMSLNGREGTFLMGDPAAGRPRGTASNSPGTPMVGASGASGDTILVRGVPSSVAGYLLRGDYIQVGSHASARLHKLLENLNTTSGGQATAVIWPNVRGTPGSGDAIYVQSCHGLWRLSTNDIAWDEHPTIYPNIQFECIEAL